MVPGIFFSEIGTWMLDYFARLDPDIESKREHFHITQSWNDADFVQAQNRLSKHTYRVAIDETNSEVIRNFLEVKGDFFLHLFHLAVRKNPFDKDASTVVQ